MPEPIKVVYFVPEDGGPIYPAVANAQGHPPGVYEAQVEVRIIKKRPHKGDPKGPMHHEPGDRYDPLG